MKVIFYGRTQVGSVVLSYLVAKGYEVKVIPEDDLIRKLCNYYDLPIVTLDNPGEFDLFICCHGKKIIKNLEDKKFINMHSCLWKYKGKDPISRYIKNKDTDASIESHYMSDKVDEGEVIERVLFKTPVVKTHGEYFNIALPYYYECIHNTIKKLTMKTAAFTRIKDDAQKLRLWLSYYTKYFDDIVVIGQQADEGLTDELSKEYTFKYIPRDEEIHSEGSLHVMSEMQQELLTNHTWVLYTDADEFVIADPKKYTDLRDFMLKSDEKQTFCEGYEIFKKVGQSEVDYSTPIFKQRQSWWKDISGSYNKPALSQIPTKWVHGFHQIEGMESGEVKNIKNTGLYMIHLKHVDDDVLEDGIGDEEPIPEKIMEFL